MTDNTNNGWGTVLGAGLVGYFLGNGGGFFNGGCARPECGENCKITAIDAKVSDLENWNQSREILGTITAGNEVVLGTLNQINRDNVALNIQGIYNQQTVARNIDQQFCNTNGIVVADGEKTRAALSNFVQLYQTDRYNDLARENAELKGKINTLPLECSLAAVNYKLDSVICCNGVKTCPSGTTATV